MKKELVGRVTNEEKEEIKVLYERASSLQEFFLILENCRDDAEKLELLYEKLISDYEKTATQFQDWWDKTTKKYNWKKLENHNWTIDFNTNCIYLFDL